MFCGNCGTPLTEETNFCPYCGAALKTRTSSISLLNKASSTAKATNVYNLVLVSTGTCDATMAGDLLEDVFGYTDAESANLVRMVPVIVGENLTAEEAATVAQMYTEYGMEVSITDKEDKYVDLTGKANSSVFDSNGNLLRDVAAVIGALTVANRITSYRRYRRPSLLERIFHIRYTPIPPVYHRSFRPYISPSPIPPRRTIRKPATPRMMPGGNRGVGGNRGFGGPDHTTGGRGPGSRHGGPGGHGGGHGGPGGHGGGRGPGRGK